jgi:hypothetical protein
MLRRMTVLFSQQFLLLLDQWCSVSIEACHRDCQPLQGSEPSESVHELNFRAAMEQIRKTLSALFTASPITKEH